MQQLNATQLAQKLGITPGRVSQLVSDGKLDGCYQGQGRQRRFDLAKAAQALGKRLDPGQMMGNGARTRRALADLVTEDDDAPAPRPAQREGGELNPQDPDRYELARTQKAEEEARKLRRQNAEADGTFVLASAVDREVARQLAQEVAEVETVLREGARRIADRLGVDFLEARRILRETWREHRAERAEKAGETAAVAQLTEEEKASDV